MLHRRIFALAFTALAFSPAASFAASATQSGYDDDSDSVVQDDTSSGSNKPQSDSGDQPTADSGDGNGSSTSTAAQASPTATSTTGSLPFTGMEAGLIAAAGLGLAGTGFALRRAAREE